MTKVFSSYNPETKMTVICLTERDALLHAGPYGEVTPQIIGETPWLISYLLIFFTLLGGFLMGWLAVGFTNTASAFAAIGICYVVLWLANKKI
jgi:hypothetical protein